MGIPLRTTQFASYNGFVFNNTTHTTNIKITPEESSDGRTVIWNRWQFTLKFEIATSIGTTDPAVAAAVALLSHPGKPFIYRGRGLGNPDINTGVVRDLKYGPKPKGIGIELNGTGNAVTLTWSVEFVAPNCPGASNPFGVLELSYKVSHVIDDAGFTTRNVSGFLVIPNNRVNPDARQVAISVDEYRPQVMTPIPFGFQRKGESFDVAGDLTRLDFRWTDEEQPVPLPAGIVEASFEDDIASTGAGLARWTGTINASYRMARGYNWMTAAKAFFEMLSALMKDRNDRLGAKKQQPGGGFALPFVPGGQGRIENVKVPSCIVPTGFRMKNPNRYGKPAASFGFTYTFASPLSQLLAATGLYLPFQHPYGAWLASVADSAHHPYGGARLVWTAQDDPGILDICGFPGELRGGGGWTPPPLPNPGTRPPGGGGTFPPAEQPVNQYVSELVSSTFSIPRPNDSWVDYQNEIFVEADTGILHVKKLPSRVPDAQDGVFAERGIVPPAVDAMAAANFNLFGNNVSLNVGGKLEPTYTTVPGIMRRTDESCVVYLRGHAYRVGYPISPPRLIAINGIPCVPDCRPDRGEGFGQGVKSNAVQTLNYAYWNLRYVLATVPPGPLPIPPNPQDKP